MRAHTQQERTERVWAMRRLIDRCAGIDVGQALLVVCVRVVDDDGKVGEQVRSFGATTPDEVPRTSRTGDPLGSFSEKVRARDSRSTEVLPRVQG
jgi:hypothetical protein